MRPKRHDWRTGCSVEATLSVIGGLWKAVILFHLLDGKKRFGELSRLVPRATQRMLTLQLRELEADGVVSRIAFPEVPPRVEYMLTKRGRSLEPVLITMRDWGLYFQGRARNSSNTHKCPELSHPELAHALTTWCLAKETREGTNDSCRTLTSFES